MSRKIDPWELILLIATITLGGISFAVDDLIARGLFGVVLVLDLTKISLRVQSSIDELVRYEYLGTDTGIWYRAMRLVEEAGNKFSLRGTTSSLNHPSFEEAILKKAINGHIHYERVMCYPPVSGAAQEKIDGLPPVSDIDGPSKEARLSSYLKWYSAFYEKMTNEVWLDQTASFAMQTWHEALNRLNEKGKLVELKSHNNYLSTDFLVSFSNGGQCEAAMLAFPTHKNQPMTSGFFTNHHPLANDFDQNLQRLLGD